MCDTAQANTLPACADYTLGLANTVQLGDTIAWAFINFRLLVSLCPSPVPFIIGAQTT